MEPLDSPAILRLRGSSQRNVTGRTKTFEVAECKSDTNSSSLQVDSTSRKLPYASVISIGELDEKISGNSPGLSHPLKTEATNLTRALTRKQTNAIF